MFLLRRGIEGILFNQLLRVGVAAVFVISNPHHILSFARLIMYDVDKLQMALSGGLWVTRTVVVGDKIE